MLVANIKKALSLKTFFLSIEKKILLLLGWSAASTSLVIHSALLSSFRLASLQSSLRVSFPDTLGLHHRGSVLVSLAQSLGEARRSVMLRNFFGRAWWRRLLFWCQIWSLEVDLLLSHGSSVPPSRRGGVCSLNLHSWSV